MDAERDRLERVYGEFGDGQLLALAEDQGNLTDAARAALMAELGKRGLQGEVAPPHELEQGFGPGIPGIFLGGASAVETALEPGGEIEGGWANLISFFDGHELSRACDALAAATIEPQVHAIDGDAMIGVPPRFEVWVAEADVTRAQALLRAQLGLFPLPEQPDTDEIDDGTLVPMASIATRLEADEVMRILASEDVTARLRTPDYGSPQDGDQTYTVEVRPSQLDRALELVEARLGMG